MSLVTRRSSSKNAQRKILQAASELFSQGGVAALSVRAIACQAGISTIGIYSYFNGKQGILDALYIEGYNMVYASMEFSSERMTPKQILLKGIKGYFAVARQYEGHYRLIFGERDNQYHPSSEAYHVAEHTFKRLVKHCSLALPKSADRATRQKVAIELWAFVHGFVSLKHHATAGLMSQSSWYDLANEGVETHVDALLAKYQS